MKRRHFLAATSSLVLAAATRATAAGRVMTVYKDPNCGCCQAWADAIGKADMGFSIDIRPTGDLSAIKRRYGVPAAMEGCHTAIVDDYFIEGHVPLEAIERLFRERPEISGLAVPGMPDGSLGMGDDPTIADYDVMSVMKDGTAGVILSVRPKKV